MSKRIALTWRLWPLVLLMLISGFAMASGVKRSISLEWEEVPDSTGYQVEVRRVLATGEKGKPMMFSTKKSVWEGKIFSGRYEMRIRSLDDRGVAGDWSEPSEFWVKIPAAELVAPAPDARLVAESEDQAEVSFRWKAVPGAGSYRLEVKNSQGAVVHSVDTAKLSETLNLDVAQVYQWQVTSLMKEGNEPGEPPTSSPKLTLVGRKLGKPSLEKPTTRFVTELSWESPKHATNYAYSLMRRRPDGKWAVVSKSDKHDTTKIAIDPKIQGGNFRLQVRALAANRVSSDVSSIDFFVHQGLRTPAAVETAMLKEAIEKDYNHLFIASYLLSNLAYEGKNAEVGNRVAKYEALAGTGRLGYGFFPKGNWGGLAIVDMSGIIIRGTNYLFASAEASAVWRTYIMRATQMRVYGGGYLRQTPESRCLTQEACKNFNITHAGPQAGVQIWHPFTYRFGLQLNSQAYFSMIGIQTPSGKDVVPTPSYQIGLLGSYKMKENLTGFAGYAYRVDTVSYKAKTAEESPNESVASANDKNSVTMTGHYLNLYLEWGF